MPILLPLYAPSRNASHHFRRIDNRHRFHIVITTLVYNECRQLNFDDSLISRSITALYDDTKLFRLNDHSLGCCTMTSHFVFIGLHASFAIAILSFRISLSLISIFISGHSAYNIKYFDASYTGDYTDAF
jgi:hypothetical protein